MSDGVDDKKRGPDFNGFASAAARGATAGGAAYAAIGGVGLAVGGTAVGITLLPFMAIGALLGAAGYGLYAAGKASND